MSGREVRLTHIGAEVRFKASVAEQTPGREGGFPGGEGRGRSRPGEPVHAPT